MRSVYYETGRQRLLRAGYHLCVRTQDGERFQDVEVAHQAIFAPAFGSTTEIGDDAPDKVSLAGTPLEGILGGGAKLKPAFVIDIRRRSSVIERAGSTIVASLDAGTIAAGGAVERIGELRLELVSGEPDILFGVAREFGSTVPLTLTLRSPSERGFRLLAAQPERPMGDPSVDVRETMTTLEAADGICRGCAAALLDSLAQLSFGEGQDALHRTRIGLRRLRALLWFLKPVLGVETAMLSTRLRSLARFLGGARELDVFCDRVLAPLRRDHPAAPGVDALFESFDRRRQDEHEKVRTFARSPAMLDFGLDLVAGLAALSSSEAAAIKHPQLREASVSVFARMRLHGRLKAFLKESRQLQHCAPDRQHDIRVKAKKLRYAAEVFHPVLGRKHSPKLIAALVRLQDLLGELNDARAGRSIALSYARETVGEGHGEPALFAAGLAAASCSLDPAATLRLAAEARDELAAHAQ